MAFLLLPHREALYGGAAGGGKSDALLMGALQWVDVPGYAALLLRRSFRDLNQAEALIPRSKEWLINTDARWNENDKRWTFPSGATLTFGYLEHEDDKYQYQGAAFHFVGFDELTQFSASQYLYLFSRTRRLKGSAVPIRVRGATNPGGRGHDWVKDRFLVRRKGVFVPARLEDNPHLDQAEYEAQLAELDPVTRARLRKGDWDARESGGYFREEWFRVVDSVSEWLQAIGADEKTSVRWHRHWDLAATEVSSESPDPDWTAGAKLGECKGTYLVADVRRARLGPGAVEALVRKTAAEDGTGVPVSIEQEPGSSGVSVAKRYAREVLQGADFRAERATGDKVERAKPFSAAAFNRLVYLLRGPWNADYLAELQPFPAVSHDDQVDASSGAFAAVSKPRYSIS